MLTRFSRDVLASDEKDFDWLFESDFEWEEEVRKRMRCSQEISSTVARARNTKTDAGFEE